VKEHHLENRVHFTGLVKPEEIPLLTAAMDIGVHTSLREGLPRAVVQILASGKPVIAFDIDGAREVIEDGVNGFLVPPEDEINLEKKLRFLIENPDICKKMGLKGKQKVFQEFSVEKMVAEIERLYFNILGKSNCLQINERKE